MPHRFALGLDFGTESARAVLVDVADGREAGTAVFAYPHGVIDARLDGIALPPGEILQDPADYLDAMKSTVPEAMRRAGVAPDEVVGIGIDFTACTIVPTGADGTPLCLEEPFRHEPHAYATLWKDHAAREEADRLSSLLAERDPDRLIRFGGKISAEWYWPKLARIAERAPHVYAFADRFVEAGDWLAWQLTGREIRSACFAGYKAQWEKATGDIPDDILRDLHPSLAGAVGEKLPADVSPIGCRAGELTGGWAEALGLMPGTPVAVPLIDAHAAVAAAGIAAPGDMLVIAGTSLCHLTLGESLVPPKGIQAVVEDGIIPGFYGYEAGQPAAGDMLLWMVRRFLPPAFQEEADERACDVFTLLEERATAIRPGASGLLALDWWNGNRSTLQDADLSGLILGLTLETRPEEVYRCLLEASAFGTRLILDTFTADGIPVERLTACGGLSERMPLLLQLMADVTERPLRISRSSQGSAAGAAIAGAVAAGRAAGGYDTYQDAIAAMGGVREAVVTPNPESAAVYRRLYTEYQCLYQAFGQGGTDVMHRLKAIQREIVDRSDIA